MAREYARVKVAIWADSDFRRLTDTAQALYFRLLSSPTMSLCGVADWRPNRLAALTAGMTPDGVYEAADELRGAGYIFTDDDTEEVLVRSFVRHDGLIKTPNIAAAMAKDFAGVASATLRGVIVHELHRLHDDQPEMKGWATASRLLSEPSIDPSGIPSPKASVMPLPIPSGNESHIPQPSSLNQQPAAPASRRKPERPIPEDWRPTDDHSRYAADNSLDVNGEAFRFRNHAIANDRRQRDWDAAFRNWLASPFAQKVSPRAHRTDLPEAWR